MTQSIFGVKTKREIKRVLIQRTGISKRRCKLGRLGYFGLTELHSELVQQESRASIGVSAFVTVEPFQWYLGEPFHCYRLYVFKVGDKTAKFKVESRYTPWSMHRLAIVSVGRKVVTVIINNFQEVFKI